MMRSIIVILAALVINGCNKSDDNTNPPPPPVAFRITEVRLGSTLVNEGQTYRGISPMPLFTVRFNDKVQRSTVPTISLKTSGGTTVPYTVTYSNNDSTLLIQPASALQYLSKYIISFPTSLQSTAGSFVGTGLNSLFHTRIDSSRKFPAISDNALLDKIQQQTFKYFWDFAHPVSGLARERNTSGDLVTSGGSGFGIMAIITGINRGFITRAEGLTRMQAMVAFLKNTAQKFHGAFPHWLNGATGAAIAFSPKDDGADLVETSYLIQGLLCARQFFDNTGVAETALRADINSIWQGVEWSWFRNGGQNVLYWHWSPLYNWDMNLPIRGWNECLITYVLAASSPTFGIPAIVYNSGWKGGSNFINGQTYFGQQLPLGPAFGGPLFFAHYSFLGIKPAGLSDASANYLTQNQRHTLINYNYCKGNPKSYYGYSDSVWGLTSSDIQGGYAASSPENDRGFIAPTAAIASMPYTPAESMAALKFYYYVLGDKLWKEYGFVDAFSLHDIWFADSFLAIDQGPIIVMIENYRSGLLWDLFTSCPEVKTGMPGLGFAAPYL